MQTSCAAIPVLIRCSAKHTSLLSVIVRAQHTLALYCSVCIIAQIAVSLHICQHADTLVYGAAQVTQRWENYVLRIFNDAFGAN